MPEMAALTHSAAEAMNTKLVHLRATMLAKMWSADGGAKTEGGLLRHAQCHCPCED